MKTGIYAGAFDPAHIGHLEMLQAAVKEYGLQRIIMIPAGNSPNKGKLDYSKSFERWRLLSSVTAVVPSAYAFSCEINTAACSYTADTIGLIHDLFPDDSLYFIIGEDNLPNLSRWYHIDDILSIAQLLIVRRENCCAYSFCSDLKTDNVSFLDSVTDISSSQVRGCLFSGKPISDLYSSDEIRLFYSTGAYLSNRLKAEIRFIKSHQKPTRFKHTLGVVSAAVSIAVKFQVDSMSVMEAAFLHDIAKELLSDTMKSLAQRCNRDLGHTEIYPVLHASAGAELSKILFSISPEIYKAILLHCTLDDDMSLLDKIIYISDMIEDSRHYPAVEMLREKFKSVSNEFDLDSLLVLAIEKNICYISSTGGVVHPASYRALRVLKK